MIGYEVKKFVEDIIKKHAFKVGSKAVKIVHIKPDEEKKLMDKDFPFVSLLSADGKIDERMGKTIQYPKKIPDSMLVNEYNIIRSQLKDSELEIFENSYQKDSSGELYEIVEMSQDERLRLRGILEPLGYNKMYQATVRGACQYVLEIRAFGKTEKESNKLLLDIVRNIPFDWEFNNYGGKIMLEEHGSSDWNSNFKDLFLSFCYVHFYMDIGTDPVEIPTVRSAKNIRGK